MVAQENSPANQSYPKDWDGFYPVGAVFQNPNGDCCEVLRYSLVGGMWMIVVKDLPGSTGPVITRFVSPSDLEFLHKIERNT